MTSNQEIVKLKVVLEKLKEKKKSVEKNYFLATKNINEIISKANSEEEKNVALIKQSKLDEATNFTVQYLDKVISQIYSVLLEIIKNNNFQLKKSEEAKNFFKNQSQNVSEDFAYKQTKEFDNYNFAQDEYGNPYQQPYNYQQTPSLTFDQETMDFVDKVLNSSNNSENSSFGVEYSIEDDNVPLNYKLNIVNENNLSVPVVESDKLDEISEISEETFSPSNFADITDKTSKEILKQIEALDEMNRSELDFYLSEVEKEIKTDAPKNVKAGLINDSEYVFSSKLKEIEDRFSKFVEEIDTLKAENKTISETNNTLFEMLQDKNAQISNTDDKPITSIPSATQYFAALDNSVDTAISKLEKVATGIDPFINAISVEQIKNLENLSMPLIKSLEKALENLSDDIKILKEENTLYRKQISENNLVIQALQEDKLRKENELNTSYNSWVANNRKLTDLENVLNKQAMEINELDDNKNDIIENLENKLIDAKNILDNVILEKQNLIEKNEKLLETIRNLRNIGFGESVDIDGHVETVSLQDIVEKEANKIVDDKIASLLDKYRNEIENIKNESMISLFATKDTEGESVLNEAIRDANPDEIALMQKQITSFENKISDLETQLRSDYRIKEKTSETINELNNLLGIPDENDYYQDKVLNSKMFALEQKISETLRKIDDIETREKERKQQEKGYSNQEIEEIVLSSDLYRNIRSELSQMEGKVIELKEENKRVLAENKKVNTELEDSFQKFAFNTAKVREIENLLDKQSEEFSELSAEKDALILALEKALLENDFSYIDKLRDELDLNDFTDVNNFAENNLKGRKSLGEIEELVSKKVNEIISEKFDELNQKYVNEMDSINHKYKVMEKEYNRIMDDSDTVSSQDLFKSDYDAYSLIPELDENDLNQQKELVENNQINENEVFAKYQEVEEVQIQETEIPNENKIDERLEEIQSINTVLETPEFNESDEIANLEKISSFEQNNNSVVEEIKNILSSKLQETIQTKDIVSNDDTLKNIWKKNQELENKINSIQNLISTNFKNFEEQLNLVSASNYPSIVNTSEIPSNLSDQIKEIINESTKFKFKEIQDTSLNMINDMKDEIKETLINEQIKQSESLQRNIDESFKVLGSKNTKELVSLKEKIGESIEFKESQRNLIEEFQNKIHSLEKENELIKLANNEKDMELSNSFVAWKNNNAKLEELENLFIILQNDMLSLEEDKIKFFNFLESIAKKKIESSVDNEVIKKFDNTSNRYFVDDVRPVILYEIEGNKEELNKEINEGVEKFSAIINEPQEVIYQKLEEIDSIITNIDDENNTLNNDEINQQVDEYIEKASNDLFEGRKDEMLRKYDLILQKIEDKYNKLNESSFKAIDDLSNKLKNIESKIDDYTQHETNVFEKALVENDEKEISELKEKLDKLQKSYDDILEKTKTLELEKENLSFDKKEKDDSATNYLVSQLIESSNQLRKFEKILINLDGEINKIESYKSGHQ